MRVQGKRQWASIFAIVAGALMGGLFLSAITSPNAFDLATFLFGAVCGACVAGLAIADNDDDSGGDWRDSR